MLSVISDRSMTVALSGALTVLEGLIQGLITLV